jgi:hypothetical protein
VRCTIDHLVVTAPTLEGGAEFVTQALGVAPGPGGQHPRMGTHNLLLKLGESTFLEVIATDPAAPPPGRPRWFALDDAASTTAPRLVGWVARTDDLRGCPADLLALLGPIETMTRGAREWLITIPADGALPLGGALPMLIEWQSPRTPAGAGLADAGCALAGLGLRHPQPERLAALLELAGLADRVTPGAGAPGVWADIVTPQGLRTLGERAQVTWSPTPAATRATPGASCSRRRSSPRRSTPT